MEVEYEKALQAQTLAVNLMPDGGSHTGVLARWKQYQKAAQDPARKNRVRHPPSEGEAP